jgi:hypothetical protein
VDHTDGYGGSLTVIDTTGGRPTVPFDAGAIDRAMAPRRGHGSRTGAIASSARPIDRDHVCDDDEIDASRWACSIRLEARGLVLTRDAPNSPGDADRALRREERSVDDAQTTVGLDHADLDIDVSDDVLDEACRRGQRHLPSCSRWCSSVSARSSSPDWRAATHLPAVRRGTPPARTLE